MAAASSGGLSLDRGVLDELVAVLSGAGNADSAVQRQIAEAIQKFNSIKEAPFYSCFVFAEMPHLPVEIRQQAGLLLKNNAIQFLQNTNIEARGAESPWHRLKLVVLGQMVAHEKEIRRVAGIVLAAIMNRERAVYFPELLPALYEMLQSPEPGVVDAAFKALQHVIEDDMNFVTCDAVFMQETAEESAEFREIQKLQKFYAERLVPRLLEYARPEAPYRKRALETLYLFQSNGAFQTYLSPVAETYWNVNSALADDPRVSYLVLQALNSMTYTIPVVVSAASPQLLDLAAKALRLSEPYETRNEAVNLVASLRRLLPKEQLQEHIAKLAPLLVANCKFTEKDYEHMSHGLLVDDDHQQPDLAKDIEPLLTADSEDSEDSWQTAKKQEPVNESGRSSWGDLHTVRKNAALLLDQLSVTYPADMAAIVLPIVEKLLEDPSWEIRESAVLILGAMSSGCGRDLAPFLERVLSLMLRLCDDPRPPLRSISLWAMSRYANFVQDNHEMLNAIVSALLTHMQDRNKACQQAAATALGMVLESVPDYLLTFAIDRILSTYALCMENYQARNQRILFHSLTIFVHCFPTELIDKPFQQRVFQPLLTRWAELPLLESSQMLYLDSITQIVVGLGTAAAELGGDIAKQSARICAAVLAAAAEGEAAAAGLQSAAPDVVFTEIVSSSLDVLSAVEDSCCALTSMMGTQEGLELLQLLLACASKETHTVGFSGKSSVFSVVGSLTMKRADVISPHASFLIKCMMPYIFFGNPIVAHNAMWSTGQVALRCGFQPSVQVLIPQVCGELVKVLQSKYMNTQVVTNAALTLGTLGAVYPQEVAPHFVSQVERWAGLMSNYICDEEKLTAFHGLAKVMECQPSSFSTHLAALLTSVASLTPWLDPEQPKPPNDHPLATQLKQAATELLVWLKTHYSTECSVAQVGAKTATILSSL